MRYILFVVFFAAACSNSEPSKDRLVIDARQPDVKTIDASTADRAVEDANKIPSIEGDWFPCIDDACAQLHHVGERYGFDTFRYLFSNQKPHKGDDYCFMSRSSLSGRFKYNGQVLKITQDYTYEKLVNYNVKIDEDIMERTVVGMSDTQRLKRVSKGNVPKCQEQKTWVCPRHPYGPGKDHTGKDYCDLVLECDQGGVNLFCYLDGSCECRALNGTNTPVILDQDTLKQFCGKMSIQDATRFVAKTCSWDVWIPEFLDE